MFFSILLCFLHNYTISYIIIPFYTYKTYFSDINTSNYYSIQNFIRNELYSYLTIGTPPQKITTKINFNEYSFNIYNNKCDIPSEYNSIDNNSTTRINKGYILTDVYIDTFLLEDIFSFPFDLNKNIKLKYIYAPMDNNDFERNIEKKKYTCANIGLKLSVDYAGTSDLNLLRELKSLDIIENYVFYLYYNNSKKEEGNLIIGKWPHEIDKDKYNILLYREIYAINNKFTLCWMIRFDKIFFKFNHKNSASIYNLKNNFEAEIDYNLNIIYGSLEFMELIEQVYFNSKIVNGICKKINLSKNNLIYYECEFSLDIKSFPEVYFYHKELSFEFSLTYEDVFILNNNKYIFAIWFESSENKNIWKLGKPFIKKYLFTFDLEKKTIGYYLNKKEVPNNLIEEEKKINIKYSIFALVILSVIAFILCFVITKFYYSRKNKNMKDKKLTELIYLNDDTK